MKIFTKSDKKFEIELSRDDTLLAYQLILNAGNYDILQFADDNSGELFVFIVDDISAVSFTKEEVALAREVQSEQEAAEEEERAKAEAEREARRIENEKAREERRHQHEREEAENAEGEAE